MPRNTNIKIRKSKKTREVYGEGRDDKILLRHLKSLYSRDSPYYIKVDCGAGGSPVDVVDHASRKTKSDETYVIVDKDRSESESSEAQQKASNNNIVLIEIELCMESMLINILEGKERKIKNHKTYFESKYIDAKKRRDIEPYRKVFSKELLDEQRKRIPLLDQIISIIEGK